MSADLSVLVDRLVDGLARENRLLMQGRVNDALRQSEVRAVTLDTLEQRLTEERGVLTPGLQSQIHRMLTLNSQNALLLQAALAGYTAGQEMGRAHSSAAGYDAGGRRVFPVESTTKKTV